ncbi:MAG: phosphotransferase [Eubacteriales bacterium]|nr:phosphotransferase [Eubacteriales bacterium]
MLNALLEQMHYPFERIEPIRSKDGVHVARVFSGTRTAVLKYFEKAEYRREIENYRILRSLGVRTLEIIAQTDSALLMEDIAASPFLRLGVESDHADPVLAEKLALWYRALHEQGAPYVAAHGARLYDETDCLTPENLALVREATGTGSLPVWRELEAGLDALLRVVRALPRTLTYNDFYYTNLIAARDRSFAFMYDYNLLGKGYVFSDLRNVTSSLQGAAVSAFLEAYGPFDPAQEAVDSVACTLTTLISACQRPSFPKWAEGSLAELRGGLREKLRRLPL